MAQSSRDAQLPQGGLAWSHGQESHGFRALRSSTDVVPDCFSFVLRVSWLIELAFEDGRQSHSGKEQIRNTAA